MSPTDTILGTLGSVKYALRCADTNLYCARINARQRRTLVSFANIQGQHLPEGRALTATIRVFDREKRRMAHRAMWEVLRALILLRAGAPLI